MDMTKRTNESTWGQEHGSSNEINRNIQSYADALQGTNNIGDAQVVNNIRYVFGTNNIGEAQGVNNTCDVFGDLSVLMEID